MARRSAAVPDGRKGKAARPRLVPASGRGLAPLSRSSAVAKGGLTSPLQYLSLCEAMTRDILDGSIELPMAGVLARVSSNAVRLMDIQLRAGKDRAA